MANGDLEQGRVPNDEEDHFQNLFQCAERGKNRVNQRPSICKVPSVLRDLSEKSFTPRMVSIGPLHKDIVKLKELEGLKESYLYDLFSRSSSQTLDEQLKECLQKVNASMGKIRQIYDAGMNKKYKDNELANMMVLDGSFILEFCLKHENLKDEATLSNKLQNNFIAMDLMLLENQIPFFVVQHIFDITKPHSTLSLDHGESNKYSPTSLIHNVLAKYVHPFFIPPETKFPDDFRVKDASKDTNHEHVLDCLHKIYQFEQLKRPSEKVGDGQPSLKYNHSVVELDRSGVIFKRQKEKNKAMAMDIIKSRSCFLSPWSKPTLVMPTLLIQEFTEVVLRNFIAYEQSFSQAGSYYFTSYASAMDMLIDNKADVGKLVESKVIVNNLGSNKKVAEVMNGICENIEIEGFCYTKEINELDEYYNSPWPNHFAYLKRTYFNNPWTAIALVAGIILFSLTVVQAVLRIMAT